MKVLLINPEVPETFWSLKNALSFMGKKCFLPPLGLLTVAAMLPEEWDKRLTDMNVSSLEDHDLRWADYVFISAMVIQQSSVTHVIDRCKAIGTKIVAGGPLFTSQPEAYLDVDHLVLKEAELTLPEFIADIQAGHPRQLYTTRENAQLHDTPVPLWSLLDMKQYVSMAVQYSRGCPFDCDFCDITMLYGRHIRTKRCEQIMAELEEIYAQGWRGNVFFVDDNFIGHKAIVKRDLLPAIQTWMKKRHHPFTFNTQASINLADDDTLMQEMVSAGFNCVFVGIETPDEQCLSECNKLQNKGRDLLECVTKIQQAGIEVQAGFIIGFDSDNAGIFDCLIQFIQNSGVVTAMVGLLNAPRGTKLYKRLAEERRLKKFVSGDNMDCSMNFHPKMGMEKLLTGYNRVIQTIYSQPHYCERILTLFKNCPLPKTRRFHLHLPEFYALIRSIWHIGIWNRQRRYFWKLIIWSIRHPQYLHLAVSLSIYGYHFRQVVANCQDSISVLIDEAKTLSVT